METGVIMATQTFKRNLLLILYREGKKKKNLTLGICFLLPLQEREKTSDGCSLFPPFGDPSLPACYPLTSVPLFWMEKSFFFSFLVLLWDLSSLTREQPMPPAMEVQTVNHWTAREVPEWIRIQNSNSRRHMIM